MKGPPQRGRGGTDGHERGKFASSGSVPAYYGAWFKTFPLLRYRRVCPGTTLFTEIVGSGTGRASGVIEAGWLSVFGVPEKMSAAARRLSTVRRPEAALRTVGCVRRLKAGRLESFGIWPGRRVRGTDGHDRRECGAPSQQVAGPGAALGAVGCKSALLAGHAQCIARSCDRRADRYVQDYADRWRPACRWHALDVAVGGVAVGEEWST